MRSNSVQRHCLVIVFERAFQFQASLSSKSKFSHFFDYRPGGWVRTLMLSSLDGALASSIW